MTVQEVFDIAIRLMDEQNESTGSTATADTREYQVRCCSLLNSVLDQVYPYSANYPGLVSGKRPVCKKVAALSEEMPVDDILCASVLPFYLAYLFCLSDSSDSTGHFKLLYENALLNAKTSMPAVCEDVGDCYGGIEYGEFGRWT